MKLWPVLLCAGCVEGIDPQWQLDHDRIVAVRATPPHVRAGEVASLDALVSHKGGMTDVELPIGAVAFHAPGDLATAVDPFGSVTGPDDAQLAAARAELGLDASAPVPLDVVMEFPDSNGIHLIAKKTVWLGDSHANASSVGLVTIDGAAPGTSIGVPADVDVSLKVDAPADAKVSWLSSAGTLRDDDEHAAILHVAPADPQQGVLAVVVRDALGGVVWALWPAGVQ